MATCPALVHLALPIPTAPRRPPRSNRTWQRLRNEYARVLVAQLERGRVSEPFHSRPPDVSAA